MNINELMGILNGYFSWNKGKAIKIKKKKHGRKAISYFRYGLDLLRDAALNGTQCIHGFLSDILGFLCMSPTESTVT